MAADRFLGGVAEDLAELPVDADDAPRHSKQGDRLPPVRTSGREGLAASAAVPQSEVSMATTRTMIGTMLMPRTPTVSILTVRWKAGASRESRRVIAAMAM